MTKPLISARHNTADFDSESYVRNFLKYLMSTSRKHAETPETKRNFVVEYAQLDGKPTASRAYYNDDAKARSRALLKWWENQSLPHGALEQDLTYLSFVVPVGGRAISNFLAPRQEGGQLVIDFTDPHAGQWCLCDMFGGNRDRFQSAIARILDDVDELVPYDSVDRAQQLEVDKILLRHVNRSWPKHRPVLSVSHNDQESPFHIHRILAR